MENASIIEKTVCKITGNNTLNFDDWYEVLHSHAQIVDKNNKSSKQLRIHLTDQSRGEPRPVIAKDKWQKMTEEEKKAYYIKYPHKDDAARKDFLKCL